MDLRLNRGKTTAKAVSSARRPACGGDEEAQLEFEQDQGIAVQEAVPRLKRPPLYKVLLVNDDYTPMEFVVHVLQSFFSKDSETATRIMLEIHTRGKGLCGIYTYEIAESKVAQVMAFSREHQHPLMCRMEPD